MTISTTAASETFLGNGVTTAFNFNFIYNTAADIQVTYNDVSGGQTILTNSQYTLFLNPPQVGAIWGIGGIVTYPTSGAPIPNGSSITVTRIVPLTQVTSISNQGDFSPQTIEAALDTLCQEIQQVAGRTGQVRGTWASGIAYNFGDIVTDGTNGANTQNIYVCAIANTSTVWATDLANGDWSLAFNVQALSPTVLTLSGDVTGTGLGNIPTTVGKIGGKIISLGGGFTTVGASNLTLTTTAPTGVTLPPSGTLYGTAAGSITSAQLASSLTDETGTGANVFATSPTLITPSLGVAAATSVNGVALSSSGSANLFLNQAGLYVSPAQTLGGSFIASGISVDFTTVPAGVRHVVIALLNVVWTGTTTAFLLQLGGVTTFPVISGYVGGGDITGNIDATYTTGFGIPYSSVQTITGTITLDLMEATVNLWSCSGTIHSTAASMSLTTGLMALGAGNALKGFRITSLSGTQTYSGGTVYVDYA